MSYPTHLVLPVLFLAAVLRAQSPLENAHRAQTLLGPDVWSRVIIVRNDTRGGTYPRTVHALVFELAGILWFYTDTDGTQSFSLHRGQLEREKSDFGPLLRDIEPGFVRWEAAAVMGPSAIRNDAPLPNGCFIESVVALRERLTRGIKVEEPRLLSYYLATPGGRKGHTVLAYDTGATVEIFDPGRRREHFAFPRKLGADAPGLARALDGREIVNARFVHLRFDRSEPNIAAAGWVGS